MNSEENLTDRVMLTKNSAMPTSCLDGAQLMTSQRYAITFSRLKSAIIEYFKFDNMLVRYCGGFAVFLCGHLCRILGKDHLCFRALSLVLNANFIPSLDGSITNSCRKSLSNNTWFQRECERYVQDLTPEPATKVFFEDPARLLGSRALIVKAHKGRERGILIVDYNFVFPTLAHFFDLKRIAEKYFLVMIPSWTGLMSAEVFSFGIIDQPVACLAYEHKDYNFLTHLKSNLHPVRATANYFCDHRKFYPQPGVRKDIDVISVAAWGTYKRYPYLFKALARLKRFRPNLKVALVGYPADLKMGDIVNLAKYFGIQTHVEFYEKITQEEINNLYARSRINVLWSRREGSGRTPIEGMLAGVPCILREGFNYGEHYEYINSQTGRFSTESGLTDTMNELIHESGSCDPRSWVLDNITPQIAMKRITKVLKIFAEQQGEPWTEDPVIATNYLNSQEYWNPVDREMFSDDYTFLKACGRFDNT